MITTTGLDFPYLGLPGRGRVDLRISLILRQFDAMILFDSELCGESSDGVMKSPMVVDLAPLSLHTKSSSLMIGLSLTMEPP